MLTGMKRVFLSLLVACGGGQSKATAPLAEAGGDPASCANVADHVIELMSANAKDAPPDLLKKQHDMFQKHCEADLWSADLRKCLIAIHERTDSDRCDPLITEAQKAAFDKDVESQEVPGASGGAPAPAAAAAPKEMKEETKTRGAPQKGGDPCEGGE
jgi:hypothetical protein